MEEKKLVCSKCGKELEWIDTTDEEGGICEGYLTESQTWKCEECNQEYYVKQTVHFCEWDTEVDIKEAN